ncbi:LytR/AlgR family response regulator transcription factor [Enterococcus avium]|uniref:LytR/AlgR family response regulator transcription factor n=1 Tax=Enterococcus avium TaxID=33945 RepID=UPI00159DB4DB|nr:LytTR family DNA-binding domain-containing protein [Enterococcus avium]NVN77987.1 response regulator [Enterococcus avium]
MSIKVYIAEDDILQRESLEQAILNYQLFSDWELELTYSTGSGEALLKNIDRRNQWNIYFLDINLEEEAELTNGFAVAQEIRKFDPFGFIIFITVRSELSFLTFQYRVQALDFIIKDPTADIRERVYTCLKTIEQRLEALTTSKTIKLNTGNEITSFILDDILYFSSNKGHVLCLHTKNNQYLIHQTTLNHLEEQLSDSFLRCHRGFLINIKAIHSITKDYSSLTLENNVSIPVAVRKKAQLKMLQSKLLFCS